ncbi:MULTISPECIES: hypothetical protein [unclassified Agromyces]|uniref:hypothetical protein n=1 Tax=unclassified Agromyces TaxID=2639701 RepID=UPI003015776E
MADFRNATWGMTQAQVRSLEIGHPKLDAEGMLLYEVIVASMDAEAFYQFREGELASASYQFREERTSPNRYVRDFNRLVELYTRKYGEPDGSHVEWHDDLYRDSPDNWGYAVERGDVAFFTKWSTTESGVSIMLSGGNYEASIFAHYVCLAHQAALTDSESLDELDMI